MFRYYRYPCLLGAVVSLPWSCKTFCRESPRGLESVCVPERSSHVTRDRGFFNASRLQALIHTEGQPQTTALHHRDAQRHDAVRRLTSLLFACRAFRTWPSVYFIFFSFFLLCRFYARRYRSITEYRYANTSRLSATDFATVRWYFCVASNVGVASTLRRVVIYASFIKLKRQGKASLRRCRIFLFFFLNDSIFFFCSLSLFAEHFHRARIYARSLYASLESYKCTYYTVKINPLSSEKNILLCIPHDLYTKHSRSTTEENRNDSPSVAVFFREWDQCYSTQITRCEYTRRKLIWRDGFSSYRPISLECHSLNYYCNSATAYKKRNSDLIFH